MQIEAIGGLAVDAVAVNRRAQMTQVNAQLMSAPSLRAEFNSAEIMVRGERLVYGLRWLAVWVGAKGAGRRRVAADRNINLSG